MIQRFQPFRTNREGVVIGPAVCTGTKITSNCRLTVGNVKRVIPLRQSLFVWLCRVVDLPVQLPEIGQRRRSHPHDQVLVLQAVVLRVLEIQLPEVLVPVPGFLSACQS